MEKIVTKNTWVGVGASIAVLLLGLVTGTSLLYQNRIAPESLTMYLTAVCGAGMFCGSMIAAKGKSRRLLRALIVCAVVYLLLWGLTLSAEGTAVFDGYAAWVTAAMWGSSVLGSFLAPKASRRNSGKKGRGQIKPRKHAVT